MSLFRKIKEKVNEVHVCIFCQRKIVDVFSSIRLEENRYICMDCFPKETKLMKVEYVCQDFSIHQLDYTCMKKYCEY